MSVQMNETFASALRDALVEQVEGTGSPKARFTRSARWIAGGGAVLVVGAAGGGIAYASGVWSQPGSKTVTPVAAAVTVTGTGTQTVDLGTPPAGTTSIGVRLTCLTAGTFRTADGASFTCDSATVGTQSATSIGILSVTPGRHSTTVTAAPGTRWRLSATYSDATTSPWGVNGHGQTYGVANQHGTPDLVAVVATNGKAGYVREADLDAKVPSSPAQARALQQNPQSAQRLIPVYKSDGVTQIGQFAITKPKTKTWSTNN